MMIYRSSGAMPLESTSHHVRGLSLHHLIMSYTCDAGIRLFDSWLIDLFIPLFIHSSFIPSFIHSIIRSFLSFIHSISLTAVYAEEPHFSQDGQWPDSGQRSPVHLHSSSPGRHQVVIAVYTILFARRLARPAGVSRPVAVGFHLRHFSPSFSRGWRVLCGHWTHDDTSFARWLNGLGKLYSPSLIV